MLGADGGGGSSIGAAIGKSAGKAVKPKSKGSSVGRSVGRVTSSRGSSTGRAATRSSSPRRSSSSGSSSRSYSGGGGSSSSSRSSGGGGGGGGGGGSFVAPAAPKPPKPPSIAAYLGTDSVYQNALSGGKRSLADFLSELGRRRGEAGTQYNQTLAGMETDRTQQLEDLKNEYASRGLIQSGIYADEQGKFQQKYLDQKNALATQQSALMADLLSQETNYRRENDLAIQAAKQEALARRAAKYKIGA
jgi:hypothetical protein